MILSNIDSARAVTIDPADVYGIAQAATSLASATGQKPSDVAKDAETIAAGIHYGRTATTEFADAMNALGLDLIA